MSDKIKAVVSDIDGTLANREAGGDRHIHDYSRVGEDAVHEDIADLLRMFWNAGYEIIIVSGRPDSCEYQTRVWLMLNEIPFSELFMRKAGDFRGDEIVKPEIYHYDIQPEYDVIYWVDDRNKVVNAMRAEGVRVLQVAPGDF